MIWKKIARRMLGVIAGAIVAVPATQMVPEDLQGTTASTVTLAAYAVVAQGLKKFSGELEKP